MFKKLLLIFLLLILPTSTLYANEEVGSIAKNWFNTFSKKISDKYSTEKEILYFEAFSDKLNELLVTKNFNEAQINLVNDLIKLSNEFVFKQKRFDEENVNKIILKTNSLLSNFKYFSYNKENIFLEDGIWYTYKFDSHLTFPK
jgi:predicted enzyme involved in methoxymalonyl-ACP biosynthesis